MKKTLSMLLTLAAVSTLVAMPASAAEMVLGDVNSDGRLSIADVVLLTRYTNEETIEISLENADFNADGILSAADTTAMLRRIAHLEDTPSDAWRQEGSTVGIRLSEKMLTMTLDEGGLNIPATLAEIEMMDEEKDISIIYSAKAAAFSTDRIYEFVLPKTENLTKDSKINLPIYLRYSVDEAVMKQNGLSFENGGNMFNGPSYALQIVAEEKDGQYIYPDSCWQFEENKPVRCAAEHSSNAYYPVTLKLDESLTSHTWDENQSMLTHIEILEKASGRMYTIWYPAANGSDLKINIPYYKDLAELFKDADGIVNYDAELDIAYIGDIVQADGTLLKNQKILTDSTVLNIGRYDADNGKTDYFAGTELVLGMDGCHTKPFTNSCKFTISMGEDLNAMFLPMNCVITIADAAGGAPMLYDASNLKCGDTLEVDLPYPTYLEDLAESENLEKRLSFQMWFAVDDTLLEKYRDADANGVLDESKIHEFEMNGQSDEYMLGLQCCFNICTATCQELSDGTQVVRLYPACCAVMQDCDFTIAESDSNILSCQMEKLAEADLEREYNLRISFDENSILHPENELISVLRFVEMTDKETGAVSQYDLAELAPEYVLNYVIPYHVDAEALTEENTILRCIGIKLYAVLDETQYSDEFLTTLWSAPCSNDYLMHYEKDGVTETCIRCSDYELILKMAEKTVHENGEYVWVLFSDCNCWCSDTQLEFRGWSQAELLGYLGFRAN